MKTKLLKKLHKKYDWYFNKESYPILIDHIRKSVTIFDLEYCCKLNNYKVEDVLSLVKVPTQEWAMRHFKNTILKTHGYRFDKAAYKIAMRKLKKRQPKE